MAPPSGRRPILLAGWRQPRTEERSSTLFDRKVSMLPPRTGHPARTRVTDCDTVVRDEARDDQWFCLYRETRSIPSRCRSRAPAEGRVRHDHTPRHDRRSCDGSSRPRRYPHATRRLVAGSHSRAAPFAVGGSCRLTARPRLSLIRSDRHSGRAVLPGLISAGKPRPILWTRLA